MTTASPSAPVSAADSMERLIDGLADAVSQRVGGRSLGFRHDTAGTPTTTGYLHGPGGNLSYPGVAPDVFHTAVGAMGLIGQLPVRPSIDTNPLFAVITGVTDDTGNEKTEVCADPPTAGILKSCNLTSVFGRYERSTPELEINRLGQRNDRADPLDLTMVGSPIANAGIFGTGPGNPDAPQDVLRNEISARMWALGVSFHRLLSQQLWRGTPANNNGDAYREITSFNLLVNTGHADAITNIACPSVDSQVNDFGYNDVENAGTSLVEILTYQYRFVRDLALRTGLNPVRWVFVMTPALFYEISAIWPCAYLTYRCSFDSEAARVLVDGSEQVRMRDELRSGSYLLIDGERVDVIKDDGIEIATSTTDANVPEGANSSTIWLLPMSVLGGRSVTYMEHYDYTNPSITSAISAMEPGAFLVEGPWLSTSKRNNWCIQMLSKIEPRLICRTPWLAARLDHVVSSPVIMTRQPFPSDPYYVNGGVTTERSGPSYYNLWQS